MTDLEDVTAAIGDGIDVSRQLARHGLDVKIDHIIREKIDVVDALLSHTVDSSAELIIMGAYGHSRLREFILGERNTEHVALNDGSGPYVALTSAAALEPAPSECSWDGCVGNRVSIMLNGIFARRLNFCDFPSASLLDSCRG